MKTGFPLLLLATAAAVALLLLVRDSQRSVAPVSVGNAATPGTPPEVSGVVEGAVGSDAAQRVEGAASADLPSRAEEPSALESADIELGAVQVTAERGAEPVPGVALVLLERETEQTARTVQTDAAGLARIDELRPGGYTIRALRGPSKEIEVRAGEVTEVRLDFKDTVTARGIVTTADGRPVAGADVLVLAWRRDWTAAEVAAETDADGRFEVPYVRRRCSLGAVAAGHGPAAPIDLELVTITDDTTEPLTLVLTHDGSAVTGRVTDPKGAPVVGARVAVGAAPRDYDTRSDGSSIEVYGARIAETDAAGRYAVSGLPAGKAPLEVWAAGFPIATSEVELVPGTTVEHDVVLQHGLFVEGTVTSVVDEGPLERAIVIALDAPFHDPFPSQGPTDRGAPFPRERTRSDAGGHYRLGPLPEGPVHLYAAKGVNYWDGEGTQYLGTAQVTLDGRAGETLRWDPALSVGLRIHGRITYADGSPLGSVFVSARTGERGGDRTEHAQPDGTFALTGLEDREYTVDVQLWDAPTDSRPLRQTNVRPSETPLLLVASYLPKPPEEHGRVRVRLVDAAGRLEGRGSVHFESGNSRHHGRATEEEGVFAAELPPGTYRPVAIAAETVVATGPEFELRPGESRELPDLQTFTPGQVEVVCERGTLDRDVHLALRGSHAWDGQWERLEGGASSTTFRDVRPGDWRVELWGMGIANATHPVHVTAGETNRVVVRLEPAVQRVIELTAPRPDGWGTIALQVTDEGASAPRATTLLQEKWSGSLPAQWELMLPVGRFRIEARRDGQVVAAAPLVVDSLQSAGPLTLVLP